MFSPRAILAYFVLVASPASADDLIEFNRDIRPILSDKCFKCHGPDAKNQQSEFRLDTHEHAIADLGGYFGIVPGDVSKSELVARLHATDPDEVMPPADSNMSLTAEQIQTIERWITQGAKYQAHWSFVPLPQAVPVPPVSWGNNEIDRFIAHRLAGENLQASPETTREKWLRRVSFDLAGLPPTLSELDDFLADGSADAYERVVDRLLASDATAERLAMEWVDVARYSDSYGFQVDKDRTVWPWRDWLIRAFRKNIPYDQFIVEQLAGDLLPEASREQILATAFSRLNPQESEGGSIPEEYRVEYVSDRLHTYSTAFLGLTMECSRCHDHKYDPITAKDYYSLSAYFANIDESGLYSYFTPAVPTPTLWLPTEEQELQLKQIESSIQDAEAELALQVEAGGTSTPAGALPLPQPLAAFSFDQRQGDKFSDSISPDQAATSPAANESVPGRRGQAVKLSGDDPLKLPIGNFSQDDPFSIALWVQVPETYERALILSRSQAWTDAASRGYEWLITDGHLEVGLVHYEPGNALRVRAQEALPLGSWQHLCLTYDGSRRAAGVKLYHNGKALALDVIRDGLTREITGGGSDTIVIGQRMRDRGLKGGLVDDCFIYDFELTSAEASALSADLTEVTPDRLTQIRRSSEYAGQAASLLTLRKERSELVTRISEIMVMRERPEPLQTYLLGRGAYTDRVEPVSATTPHFLPAPPEGTPSNRLGLAQWTVSEANPLTARVTVNRYWQMMFGKGLVATTEDFGSQGKLPTHPELLDWLARDFVSHGWDLHRLLKQIALSATYRQQSEISSGTNHESDPENSLLYRYPAPRLTAEQLRDNALAASGLLVSTIGGPSVKPYDIALSYKPSAPDTGPGLYRRSLYTLWKQSGPTPLMTTLNASKRDVCRVRLDRTDSPLQGLVFFNSTQFVEAARVLAATLVSTHGEADEAIIQEAFRRLTSRLPDSEESKILKQLLQEQQTHFTENPADASQLLAIGSSAPPDAAQTPRIAAVTALVSALFNFDECVSKR